MQAIAEQAELDSMTAIQSPAALESEGDDVVYVVMAGPRDSDRPTLPNTGV